MLVIRLNRYGKKNQAQFRVILQEKSKAPGHRHVEVLGSHNPHSKETLLKKERILHWIGQGAQPSDRVHNMLVKAGVIEGKIVPKKMKRPEVKQESGAESQESGEKKMEAVAETKAEEMKTEEVKAEAAKEAAPAEAPAEEAKA